MKVSFLSSFDEMTEMYVHKISRSRSVSCGVRTENRMIIIGGKTIMQTAVAAAYKLKS